MRINKKLVGAALVVAAIGYTGSASTASNTVAADAGRLGFSDTTVTGGEVLSINYDLDASHNIVATHIDVVDMVPAAVVTVQLDATTEVTCVKGVAGAGVSPDVSSIYDCTNAGDVSAAALAHVFITIEAS